MLKSSALRVGVKTFYNIYFQKGETGRNTFERGKQVLFHNSVIGNFMVYQYRLEIHLLQLFADSENSE